MELKLQMIKEDYQKKKLSVKIINKHILRNA